MCIITMGTPNSATVENIKGSCRPPDSYVDLNDEMQYDTMQYYGNT